MMWWRSLFERATLLHLVKNIFKHNESTVRVFVMDSNNSLWMFLSPGWVMGDSLFSFMAYSEKHMPVSSIPRIQRLHDVSRQCKVQAE